MDYAIVLYFDKGTEAKLQDMVVQVAEACGSRYVMDHVRPHVTISALEGDDEPALLEQVKRVARELPEGDVPLGSVGSFVPLVLYVAPVVNSYLQNACQRANDLALTVCRVGNRGRYLPGQWVPHIAMGQKLDHDTLTKAFDCLQRAFTPMMARAEAVALVRWEPHDPYQELAVFALKKD